MNEHVDKSARRPGIFSSYQLRDPIQKLRRDSITSITSSAQPGSPGPARFLGDYLDFGPAGDPVLLKLSATREPNRPYEITVRSTFVYLPIYNWCATCKHRDD